MQAAQALGARAVALQLDIGDSASFSAFATAAREALHTHTGTRTLRLFAQQRGRGRARELCRHHRGAVRPDGACASQRPVSADASAAAPDAGRRPHSQCVVRPGPLFDARLCGLRGHEGWHRSAHAVPGAGAGASPHRGEHHRAGRDRHRLRGRHRARQRPSQQFPSPPRPHWAGWARPTTSAT